MVLAKFDIYRAYRLLRFFVDLALPFGLRSAPRIFSRFADVLLAILKSSGGGPYLQNYLDDSLIISPPTPYLCQSPLSQCLRVCHLLGIPIAPDKTEGPSTSLTYLGFLFDTVKMELQLPPSKLEKVRSALSLWSNRKRGPKRELLSLVGLLQHACQAIPHGRPFLRWLIDRAYSVKELHHFVRLSPWQCDDVNFWFTLLLDWNSKCLFLLSAQDPFHFLGCCWGVRLCSNL